MKKQLLLISIASLALLVSCNRSTSSPTSSVSDSSSNISSSLVETFTISADSQIKGGVLSFDQTSAKKGDVITITVTPEENKVLKELTSSVTGVTFTTVKENETYTFVMPGENITISATFIGNNLLSFVNVSPNFLDINDDENVFGSKHKEGDEIYFEIKATEGGVLSILDEGILEHIYVHVGNDVIRPTFAKGGETTGLLPVSFKMPADATTVYIVYSIQQHQVEEGHSVTFQVADGFKLLGVTENTKYDYLNAYLIREEGYSVTSFQWKYKDTDDWYDISYQFKNNISEFAIRPYSDGLTDDIIIKVEGQLVGSQDIEFTNADNVNFFTTDEYGYGYVSTSAPSKVLVGETVSFYVKPVGGKHLKSITIQGVDYTPDVNPSNYTYLSFVMPDNKVSITFNCEENGTITVAENNLLDSVIIKNNFSYEGWEISSAAPGETFYVIPSAKEGYEVIGGSLNGGEMKPYQRYEDYESMDSAYAIAFVMPENGNAVITLNIGTTHKVNTTASDNISFATYGKDSYAVSAKVEFSVNPGMQYDIDEVKVHKVDDASTTINVSYDEGGYYPYFFIMPDFDVVIEVEKTEKAKTSVAVDYQALADIFDSITISQPSLRTTKTITPSSSLSSLDLYVNEDVMVEVVLKSNTYSVLLESLDNTSHQHNVSNFNIYSGKAYYTFDSFKVTDTLTSLSFSKESKTAKSATITDTTNGAVTAKYKVNDGQLLSSLPALYQGDMVKVYLTLTDEEDTNTYSVKYNGNTVSSSTEYDEEYNMVTYYYFTVDNTESVSIELVKAVTHTLTVINPLEDDYGITIADYNWNTYSGEPVSFKENASQFVRLDGNDDEILVNVEVSVGGVVDDSLSGYGVTTWNATLVFKADIVITVSEA